MWGWGRPRRDLPAVNYAESEEEDSDKEDINLPDNAFSSPLQSPARPVVTRAASPVILAHPTLNDNVDEVLEEVQYKLHDIAQVEEEIEELTDLFEDTDTKLGDIKVKCESQDDSEVGEEVENFGEVIGRPQGEDCEVPLDNDDDSIVEKFECCTS